MAFRFRHRGVGGSQENSDPSLLRGRCRSPSPPLSVRSHSASWWADREEHKDQVLSLREEVEEKDRHAARLQDMLRCERDKLTRLQLRFNQQEAELKRREQQNNRLRERLSQLTDRHREKGPSIEVLNFKPVGRGKRDLPIRSVRSNPRREEEALRLMLERREAELREAMKLRHSLTSLLHALRGDMERALSDFMDDQEEGHTDDKRLVEAEFALGDHVTGGVVQGWRKVQRRLGHILFEGQNSGNTDHDKLLAQLETELKESQQLIKLQQQLLQDNLASPVPPELADCYFLEEWERIQARWAELNRQKQDFERERQSFTDAAIRLGHERRDFDQQRASFLKQRYLCESPLFGKEAPCNHRRESTALNFSGLGPVSISGCLPVTPSPTDSGTTALSGSCEEQDQGRVRVQTPSTPELYAALNLPHRYRAMGDGQSETLNGMAERTEHMPNAPYLNWSF
ncbi:afadin- and alpha-actinin-binding protein [Myripristis murdjan]|uniref:afadin- and alpha-actinin-binding protein n=1 Tax=Myripristis murdjan TaxID=586833 RepID=UPI001175E292|nr:afadin- and alpha-actinin-binding protein-like [Myripristis murdjan]XP_029920743.1 afadin- and alpha-actinin-binding protein-like [Myripristis murdjan]